jgi:hypothetical protein
VRLDSFTPNLLSYMLLPWNIYSGGVVISEAGTHEKVAALVYIAAFAPDAGREFIEAHDAFTDGGLAVSIVEKLRASR